MSDALTRDRIFPENQLPDAANLLSGAAQLASTCQTHKSPFTEYYGVACEADYKRQKMATHNVMLHAQIGYRTLEKSRRAYAEIHDRLENAGYRVDRYGICLDWSMGYPASQRPGKPKGTGLILESDEDFVRLTQAAPVAAHFGDFVIGMPSAVENTCAALRAGATSIGNLGQYFTFRLPDWHDDVSTTAATVTALKLAASQPIEILIHSNLDDGFAAVFTDVCCAVGAVLIEKYIVEDLLGSHIAHCYGHTFSDVKVRFAFQRALASLTDIPGTMVYGNTTIYGDSEIANYAALASYLSIDIAAQKLKPSGHAINPVPVTEAMRIPEIDEVVNAHLFANRLIERSNETPEMLELESIDLVTRTLLEGGTRFKNNVLNILEQAGVDIQNPFEMLLAIRRIGGKHLEQLCGPGAKDKNKRKPLIQASPVNELEQRARCVIDALAAVDCKRLRDSNLVACSASTDVHEYGKMLLDETFVQLNIGIADAGVSVDPDALATAAKQSKADFIALSTYNGVALDFVQRLHAELRNANYKGLVYVGGKLNQITHNDNSDMPFDVSEALTAAGAVVCHKIEDMYAHLLNSLPES